MFEGRKINISNYLKSKTLNLLSSKKKTKTIGEKNENDDQEI